MLFAAVEPIAVEGAKTVSPPKIQHARLAYPGPGWVGDSGVCHGRIGLVDLATIPPVSASARCQPAGGRRLVSPSRNRTTVLDVLPPKLHPSTLSHGRDRMSEWFLSEYRVKCPADFARRYQRRARFRTTA